MLALNAGYLTLSSGYGLIPRSKVGDIDVEFGIRSLPLAVLHRVQAILSQQVSKSAVSKQQSAVSGFILPAYPSVRCRRGVRAASLLIADR